jgi:hypothetical protein
MRTARHRLVTPRFRRVQFFDQGKQALFGAVDVGAEGNDFGTQGFGAHGLGFDTVWMNSIAKSANKFNSQRRNRGAIGPRCDDATNVMRRGVR